MNRRAFMTDLQGFRVFETYLKGFGVYMIQLQGFMTLRKGHMGQQDAAYDLFAGVYGTSKGVIGMIQVL